MMKIASWIKYVLIGLLIGLIVGGLVGFVYANSLLKPGAGVSCTGYIDKIKSRGKLIMGTSADWPPFEYVDKQGNIVGIDVEIGKRIAESIGVPLEIKDMKFAALIEALKNGMVDIVIADMVPTADRLKQVDFSLPYYIRKGNAVIVLKNSSIKDINDLYGKTIGVQLGTVQEKWAQDNLNGKATIKSYDRVYPEMIMTLKRGDLDAIIVADKIGEALVTKDPDLKIAFYVGPSSVGGSVAMPKCAEDLKYVVNKVIENFINSGEIEKIFRDETLKWLESS
jgi:polar amino acid transport system substrate-binding protein